ncbi:MAG: SoxR reducing system RseC family protein, partial [Rhodocyclaceae bacterium]|nr:SoxR reducing system RseC family protein [Rhodocyclaceae bacterium]
VDVALRGGTFLWASFLAYLLPPAALALAAALATAAGWSDVATAAVCLPVLLLALVPVWLAGRGGRIWRELRIEQPPSGRP